MKGGDGSGQNLEIALIHDKAVFPCAQVLAAIEPPDIHHFVRDGIGGFNRGNDIPVADEKSGGAISVVLVEAVARLPQPAAVGGGDKQALRGARLDRIERRPECRRSGPQRIGKIHRQDVIAQVAGDGGGSGGQLFFVRGRRRGKVHTVNGVCGSARSGSPAQRPRPSSELSSS